MSVRDLHPQPEKAPSMLYHVTRPQLVDAIRDEGLLGTPYVFMSESVEDCLAFMTLRLGTFVDFENLDYRRLDLAPEDLVERVRTGAQPGRIEVEDDPTSPTGTREVCYVGMPRMERNSHLAVIAVDAEALDASRLRRSDDHATFIFGDATSWMHAGDVPPEAIIGAHLVGI